METMETYSLKSWVFTFRVEPPDHTVLAKSGGAIFDAWYGKWTRQWIQVLPGGREKEILEPNMIYVTDEYASTHRRDLTRHPVRVHNSLRLRKSKSVQLSLF